jgi:acyl carrier protein
MKITKEELKKIVAKICLIDATVIKDETLLIGELKMDSIKIVELLATLSEEYDIHAAEHDAAQFNTFKDLFAFTERQQ